MKITLDLHDASKERPAKSGEVLTVSVWCGRAYNVAKTYYSTKHNLFNALDTDTPKEAAKSAIAVTYWTDFEEVQKQIKKGL